MRFAHKLGTVIAAFAIAMVMSSRAEAVAIGLCDNALDVAGSNGTCTKSVTITGNTLTIVLNNTTDPALGGFITADAFFLAGGVTATLSSTTNANFSLTSGNIGAMPFPGPFNNLLSTSGDFEGGGGPDTGIAPGGSATFVLALSGNVAGLTEQGVLLTEAIRFRGFVGGGSDKDTVTTSGAGGGGGGGQTVPEPASLALFGAAMLGLAYRARRNRN